MPSVLSKTQMWLCSSIAWNISVFIQKSNSYHRMDKLLSGPYFPLQFQFPSTSYIPIKVQTKDSRKAGISKGPPLISDEGCFPSTLPLCPSFFILQMPYLVSLVYSQKHLVHTSILAFSLFIEIVCLSVYLLNKIVGPQVNLLNWTAS